jgi:hypothetical protein
LDITKTSNFCYFFENLLSYPLGKFKVKTHSPPPIGYPDPSIGGVPILNGIYDGFNLQMPIKKGTTGGTTRGMVEGMSPKKF